MGVGMLVLGFKTPRQASPYGWNTISAKGTVKVK
jgi:hypothetical protein